MAQQSLGVWEMVTLGATSVGCLVGGLIVGLALDDHLDTLPAWTLIGLTVGLVGGSAIAYVRIRQFLRG
ncbi:MAG: AtpZ/AtpI family protein [Pseudonocardiales bacterium]